VGHIFDGVEIKMEKDDGRGMDGGITSRLKPPLYLEEVVEHWPAVERKALQNISTNINYIII
jgi:hypothetical protein